MSKKINVTLLHRMHVVEWQLLRQHASLLHHQVLKRQGEGQGEVKHPGLSLITRINVITSSSSGETLSHRR